MKTAILVLLGALAIFAQVTVAPRFPISGAIFNFPLIVLVLTAAFAGPTSAMVATPIIAILLGFASDRSPGLLLIGYLPLLPLGVLIEQSRLPLTDFFQTLAAGLITGAWLRGVLAFAVMVQGAGFTVAVLTKVILPGLLLDFALLAVVYLALRLIGLNGRSLTLSRGGFLAHE
jgi:hypothetical protein